MKQPVRKERARANKKAVSRKLVVRKANGKRADKPKQFGTSKLEQDFARDFLDKLGVEYEWQFEAKDIGRFYDFKIKDGPIIEVNGTYWHGDERIYESTELNRTQRKNRFVDGLKQKWALMHGIPIYYVWEKDIREKPKDVMEFLKTILYVKEKDKTKKNVIRHGKKEIYGGTVT